MPNLVGIGNSQVPTNAMLGGLAYQDPAHANLTSVEIENIAAIKQKISDTATDIFVYDTRKDSDGGAWRKRTQHTSWYNEAVGEYRGARKEFPAVAVIVTTSSALTIYDADDPNCSMWMVFVNDNAKWLKHTTSGPNSVVAMNGVVVSCGSGGAGRLSVVNFVSDNGYVTEPSYTYRHNWIATRNSTAVGPTDGGTRSIVNISCHAVAITVLPNAPIDPDTGLPKPTIAVGTEGGVSVLKHDGENLIPGYTSSNQNFGVYEFTGFNPVTFVAMEGEDLVAALGGTTTHDFIFKTNLPSHDESFDAQITAGSGKNYYMNSSSGTTPLLRDLNMTAMSYNPSDGTVYRGGVNGIDIITEPRTVSGTSNISLISYVDTDYNSGYMVGDIKGAWLASTDATDANADTLQDNSHSTLDSTFATSTGWTANADWTISGGVATCDGQNNGRWLYPNNSTMFTQGTSVVVEVTVTARTSGTLYISYGTGGLTAGTSMTATGTYYHVGECTGNGIVYLRSDSFIGSVDNVKMYVAEADRSLNNKGLVVVGTVTKDVVAKDADLVHYTGIHQPNGNYLYQPYNADLNFGTGDFSCILWGYLSSTGGDGDSYLISRRSASTEGFFTYYDYGTPYLRFRTSESSSYSTIDVQNPNILDRWVCYGFVRRNGMQYIYLDGKERGYTTSTKNVDSTAKLTVGWTEPFPATARTSNRFSLVRVSASAPSSAQMKKIFEDEKHLFHENAKCTISGATSAVTALGFDDSTDTLHVGTSSARSDFRGLNRINNTTTAVTTAISASNGLVAEQ